MLTRDALLELFEYNYWARDRQLQACAALAPEDFTRPLGGSFPSLRDILAHMLGVERLWLERWRGNPAPGLPPAAEFPGLAAIEVRWRAVEADMRAYLAGLTDADLCRVVSYVNTRGETWTYPLDRMLYHLWNHQSYHRGQVTDRLRQLGAPAVPVDFLVAQDAGIFGEGHRE
jgi:uncharacterized damage-inducible protein DinB